MTATAGIRVPSAGASPDRWAAFYRDVRPVAFRSMLRVLPHPYEEIEDLFHDLFIRLCTRIDQLRRMAAEDVGRYVWVAARHRALNYNRHRLARGSSISLDTASTSGDDLAAPTSDTAGPDVDALLAFLGEEERRLMRERYLNGRTIAEIAKIEKRSYSAVAVQLFRALGKIRKGSGEGM